MSPPELNPKITNAERGQTHLDFLRTTLYDGRADVAFNNYNADNLKGASCGQMAIRIPVNRDPAGQTTRENANPTPNSFRFSNAVDPRSSTDRLACIDNPEAFSAIIQVARVRTSGTSLRVTENTPEHLCLSDKVFEQQIPLTGAQLDRKLSNLPSKGGPGGLGLHLDKISLLGKDDGIRRWGSGRRHACEDRVA
ncbi:hypothetical protein B0H19DRAFT_1067250 [Mycena capillaripes]|nr:hypothetical protein B0H19DRAFT_1067250 [Mycena capillaripes]